VRVQDLHLLPKVRDSASYLYVERCRIEQQQRAVAIVDARGRAPVPCTNLTTLLLGPGTTITHAAIKNLAGCGCLVAWVGEDMLRFYATGLGETRSARNVIRQAQLMSDPSRRLEVVRRLYELRFDESLPPGLSLQQVRGLEGVRVREAYAQAGRETGVPWRGRAYRRDSWEDADEINRALSTASSYLYGMCHAAIVSAGYSPALGFIHTGKALSFVYDIADLYRTETVIPVAFRCVAAESAGVETSIRKTLRDVLVEHRVLDRIVGDIAHALDVTASDDEDIERDPSTPGSLWDPDDGAAPGGTSHG
jgi:CRISPR-associated protein Cas1